MIKSNSLFITNVTILMLAFGGMQVGYGVALFHHGHEPYAFYLFLGFMTVIGGAAGLLYNYYLQYDLLKQTYNLLQQYREEVRLGDDKIMSLWNLLQKAYKSQHEKV